MKYVLIFVCLNIGTKWVKTFTAEATSLKCTYTSYVFYTFLQGVEMITSYTHDIKVLRSP